MPTPKPYRSTSGTTTYRVRVRDGQGRSTSETFPTLKAAEGFCTRVDQIGARAALAEKNRADVASDEYVPTLAEFLPRHIADLTGVTDRTRLDYHAMARRTFLPELGHLAVDLIDRSAVAAFINAMETRGLKAKSIHNAHGLLSAVMSSAVEAELANRNPCTRMRLPRVGEHERQDERFLTHPEFAALYTAMPEPHRALLMTLFGTGVRWSEATALQVRDINPAAQTMRVVKAWKATPGRAREIGPPKSAKSRRTVMLADPVLEHLAPLLDRPQDAFLFTGARGATIHHGSWRHRVWVPACEAAGLNPAPRIHDARHTHASWLIEQGATLEQVQDQLGHESILTTRKVYGHLQPAMRASLQQAATRAMQAPQIGP